MALKQVEIPKRPADLPGKRKAAARVLANKCPWCGASDIEGGPVEIDDGSARQDVDCKECGQEWVEWYDRAAVTFYGPGKGQWTDELPKGAR